MENRGIYSVHPMIIFWLGVLTGALIVGLVFLQKGLPGSNYNNALIRGGNPIGDPIGK